MQVNSILMPAGRPTKYKEEYNDQAYKLTLLGATDADLADFFEVEEKTINNWKEEHKEFLQSVTRGKDIADAEVANSFYKRAKGYRYKETREEKKDGKLVKEVVMEKELPGDPGAQLNWLKNRQPNKWRDKVNIDHTTDGESLNERISDEARAERIFELVQRKRKG
ncbi:DUF5343 domain-containing protein [Gracilimonas sediminicola]|uniref:DUF5343 domain-containing protein n=1 Tax=Gracilimonas sediminicola TaxID=2952158 RepID=A0A9X2L0M3_9BACT|nr:DUF5343 domain-containing protein [Gracilimonas sediminicola]MCP9290010.1 DUF5343 domain-containing protein [Gracilimonas sediminicola]